MMYELCDTQDFCVIAFRCIYSCSDYVKHGTICHKNDQMIRRCTCKGFEDLGNSVCCTCLIITDIDRVSGIRESCQPLQHPPFIL